MQEQIAGDELWPDNLDRPQEAVSHFKIVLRLKPNELQAEMNLQRAEAQLKKNRALQENK